MLGLFIGFGQIAIPASFLTALGDDATKAQWKTNMQNLAGGGAGLDEFDALWADRLRMAGGHLI